MARDDEGLEFNTVYLNTDTYNHLKQTKELAMPYPKEIKFELGERIVLCNADTNLAVSTLVCSLKTVAVRDIEKRDLTPTACLHSRKSILKNLNGLSKSTLKPSDLVQIVGFKKIEYSLKELKHGRTSTCTKQGS